LWNLERRGQAFKLDGSMVKSTDGRWGVLVGHLHRACALHRFLMGRARFPVHERFANRREAGRRLAEALVPLRLARPLVLALPRGGVPVAYEIAVALDAPLDVLIVRKLGSPGHPELGLGAVVDGAHPQRILNERVMEMVRPSAAYLEEEERRQLAVIAERKERLRRARPPEPIAGRSVVLVDDGIATGGTARAALQALSRSGAARTVLAVPVAPPESLAEMPLAPEDIVCLLAPPDFMAVGAYYDDFSQTDDDEVAELLERAGRRAAPSGGPPAAT
jgi:putative phosphoribosyl transferase